MKEELKTDWPKSTQTSVPSFSENVSGAVKAG